MRRPQATKTRFTVERHLRSQRTPATQRTRTGTKHAEPRASGGPPKPVEREGARWAVACRPDLPATVLYSSQPHPTHPFSADPNQSGRPPTMALPSPGNTLRQQCVRGRPTARPAHCVLDSGPGAYLSSSLVSEAASASTNRRPFSRTLFTIQSSDCLTG